MAEPQASQVRACLRDEGTYAEGGAKCFWPGLGITFGEGQDEVGVLVCLECCLVAFHHAGAETRVGLSTAGVASLANFYERLVLPLKYGRA